MEETSIAHSENHNARAPRKTQGSFNAPVLTLAPKLIFGDSEAALIITPQFSDKGNFLVDSSVRNNNLS